MQQLRAQAFAASGEPYASVEAAQNACLYERLGQNTFFRLSEEFYDRVYSDEAWFRDIFSNSTRAQAVQNQREFLIQTFGGPPFYRDRKGHTALLGRHGPYNISDVAAERWLGHMHAAVHSVVEDEECRELLMGYFRHMAWFVVYGKELVSGMRTVGYYGKHHEGQV